MQGYVLAVQLGHTIVEPRPSLFTFKIKDSYLNKLAGVSYFVPIHCNPFLLFI